MRSSSYLLLAVLIAVVAIVMVPIIITTNKKASSGEETAQSLTSDISDLRDRRQSLSRFNIACLIGVALFSAGLVVTTRLLDKSSDDLSESQEKLGKIKDNDFALKIATVEGNARTEARRIEAQSKIDVAAANKKTTIHGQR
jgi:hypothetical protein